MKILNENIVSSFAENYSFQYDGGYFAFMEGANHADKEIYPIMLKFGEFINNYTVNKFKEEKGITKTIEELFKEFKSNL